jgi:hypothetical protein
MGKEVKTGKGPVLGGNEKVGIAIVLEVVTSGKPNVISSIVVAPVG